MRTSPLQFLDTPALHLLAAIEGILVSNGALHAPALLALRSARHRQR